MLGDPATKRIAISGEPSPLDYQQIGITSEDRLARRKGDGGNIDPSS